MADELDLDAIEARQRTASATHSRGPVLEVIDEDVPALVAEVRRLRSEVDAWHVHTKSHPAAVGCVTDGEGKCRYCGAEEPPPWPIDRGDATVDRVFRRGEGS